VFDGFVTRRLLVAAAAAFVAAGCGAGSDDTRLAEAAKRTEATGTSRIEVTAVELQGDRRRTDCEGVADYREQRLRLTCTDGGSFVAIDDDVYARGSQLGILGAGDRWVRLPQGTNDGLDRLSPVGMLAWLRSASEQEEQLGEADVRGEPATLYRLTVVCTQVDLVCDGETAPVEVAVGDDGLVRRLRVQDGDADLTLTFFDFGTDAPIDRPPPSQVVDVDDFRPGPCRGGAHPIDAGQAMAALRRAGFEVERDDECIGDVVAAIGGAYAGEGGSGAAFVMCTLRGEGSAAGGTSLEESAVGAQLRHANLTCNVYGVSGGGPSAANVERVRGAFDELARELRS
jgi:hypothetical protein